MLTSERPHQRFHLLQFWPRRNEACCWPLVSSGKLMLCPLCPLCCIQGSKTQGYALTWFSHFGYQSIWSKADNLQSILRGWWGHVNCKTDRGPGPHQKDMPWKISSQLFLNLTSDTSLCCLCPTARSMWNGRTLRLAGENSWVDIDVTLLDSLEISHIA